MSRSWWARAALLVFLLIVSCVILMPTVVEMALYPESKDEVVGQDEENAVRNPPLPEWYTSLPSWLKSKTLSLGLDLQGGLMLRYSVDIDSAIDDTMRLIDQPVNKDLTVNRIMELLEQFDGRFTLQTCFLRGDVRKPNPDRSEQYILGHVDNTTPAELEAWYQAVDRLHPEMIMIYVIDRKTPVETLQKISPEEMQKIADQKLYEVKAMHHHPEVV